MNRFGLPQDRIAKRLGVNQASIHNHLLKMAALPNSINGFFASYNAFPGRAFEREKSATTLFGRSRSDVGRKSNVVPVALKRFSQQGGH
jgi:hypothetical protein